MERARGDDQAQRWTRPDAISMNSWLNPEGLMWPSNPVTRAYLYKSCFGDNRPLDNNKHGGNHVRNVPTPVGDDAPTSERPD